MNRLFELAAGPYITRHDADDLSRPERFARQVAFLQSQPAIGVLGTRVQFIDPNGQPLELNYFSSHLSNAELQKELLHDNCFCQGSVMFRRALLNQVGLYDSGNIGSEDYDLWLRLAEITQIAMLGEVLYDYRVHPDSLSHRRRHQQAFHAAHALEQAVQRRFGPAAAAEQRRAVAHYYLRAAVAACQADDMPAARDDARHAVKIYDHVWQEQAALTLLLLPRITAHRTTADALGVVRKLFDQCLPLTWRLSRLKARWLSEIYMRAVFRDRQRLTVSEWRRYLWLGVWYRPAWLFNRGVLALLLKPHSARLSQT
jgi:hypothetical protein